MDETTAQQYLERIGAALPDQPSAEALRSLHEAHLLSVPFENLSIHLGEPIDLEEAALVGKVIRRRRGGFCYELNGAFAGLLSCLGYDVTLLAARVFSGDGPGPPFAHLALRVENGGPWLVDVGFGDHSVRPLRLDEPGPQSDPAGTFQVVPAGEDVDVFRDGRPRYRVEPRRRELADFEPTCWWMQTSPKSPFTQSLVCSLATEEGRVTLSGRRLVRTAGAGRAETVLGGDAEVLEAYRTRFGVVLERAPQIGDR